MKTLKEQLEVVLDTIKITTIDNSDNCLRGDTRGETLWSLENRKEIIDKLENLYDPDYAKKLAERLKAAEDFINFEGMYHATWERKFELFKKWYNLTK